MSFQDYQKKLLQTSEECYNEMIKNSNITPKIIDESIDTIREWFSKQPHLAKIKLDVDVVKRSLNNHDFSVERTKEKLNNYFILKSRAPHIYMDRDTLEFDELCETIDFCIMPKMRSDHCRVLVIGLNSDDSSSFDPIALGKLIYIISDIRTKIDNNSSEILVVDCVNTTMSHVGKFLTFVKDVTAVVHGCYGIKIKSIHILNSPPFVYNAYAIIKPLIKKKISERVVFHKNYSDMYKYISPEFLPSDFGGHQASKREITLNWKNAIRSEELRNWVLESNKYKSDESLRVNKDDNLDENYGAAGTFRTINID